VTKTFYKDVLPLPSRALAVALAEEWESQGEKIDMKSMHLNTIMAKGIRAGHDHTLTKHFQEQLQLILEND